MSPIPPVRPAGGVRPPGTRRTAPATRVARVAVGILVIAAALLVGACSGSDTAEDARPDDSGGVTSTAVTTTTSTPPPDPTSVAPVPSPGCAPADDATTTTPPADGQEQVTTTSGDTDRWYLRHVPNVYEADVPMPLVIDLHGYSEGAQIHSLTSSLSELGDMAGFITVTPQGQGSPAHWDTQIDSPDVAFVGQLMDETSEQYCVDLARIHVAGFSNGAFLTSAVACAYSDRIAAVAPVAGMRDIPGCAPQRPVPVISFHGTADRFVAYEGGLGPAAAELPASDGSGRTLGEVRDEDGSSTDPAAVAAQGDPDESVPEIAQAWATRNGCAHDGDAVDATETSVADDVTLFSFTCPVGAEVQLYRVTDGGHSWPGSEFSRTIEAVVGPTTFSIDANALIWQFFTQHPLSAG
ncbi:hypothetical protein BH10ACT3_BH10ACT3_00700 [soil metagenome]